MSVASLGRDVEAAIAREAGGRRPASDTIFNKPGEEYVGYGLKVPALYRVFRSFKVQILDLTLEQRLDLAARLLKRRIGEVGHAGIHVLRLSAKSLSPKHFRAIEKMADDFTGWSHVDDFCDGVLQPMLQLYPEQTMRLLERWTRSTNRWKRRSSVVAFTRKLGASGQYVDQVLTFSDRLAFDPEDLVQKGVGWALKDNMRGNKRRVLAYVKELRRRGAPSTVTLYAIRDLKGAERDAVLAIKSKRS
jgi:3-methyladenine DNA glycosylase AlkD